MQHHNEDDDGDGDGDGYNDDDHDDDDDDDDGDDDDYDDDADDQMFAQTHSRLILDMIIWDKYYAFCPGAPPRDPPLQLR